MTNADGAVIIARVSSSHRALQTPNAVPFDRLSVLVSLVVVGLTFSLLLDLPTRTFDFSFLGSRATIIFSGAWVFALLVTVLTAAGVESVIRAHPRVHLSETRYTAILWVLPCTLAMGAGLVVPAFPGGRMFALAGIALTGVLLTLIVLGEYYTIDLLDPVYSFARLGLNLATYLTALLLFAAIYALKVRSILSAPVTGILAGLLALELLRGSESDVRRTWLYAATVGLVMGETIWAINYWNVSLFIGSVTMLLVFYVLTGLVQQYLWGHLRGRTLVEFVLVILLAIGLVFFRRGA